VICKWLRIRREHIDLMKRHPSLKVRGNGSISVDANELIRSPEVQEQLKRLAGSSRVKAMRRAE